jgi:hypothetical protein
MTFPPGSPSETAPAWRCVMAQAALRTMCIPAKCTILLLSDVHTILLLSKACGGCPCQMPAHLSSLLHEAGVGAPDAQRLARHNMIAIDFIYFLLCQPALSNTHFLRE